jgi:hypothetical protein
MSYVVTECDHCGLADDHPKVHTFDGGTTHHDCVSRKVKLSILAGSQSQHPLIAGKIFDASDKGMRGNELREFGLSLEMADHGDAVMMATSGIDNAMANAILTALTPVAATATIGTVTVTFPIRCRFDSVMTTTDTGASTEWITAAGYTSGVGAPSLGANWAVAAAGSRASSTAVTVTNAPAQTWAGNELWDSSGTPLRGPWGVITGGSKTVNLGDTCTIISGSLAATLA